MPQKNLSLKKILIFNHPIFVPIMCLTTVLTSAFFISLLLKDYSTDFFIWWFTLFIFGIAAFPLAARLFHQYKTKGYGFSKAIGILFSSLFLWTLSHFRLLPFTFWSVLLVLILLSIFAWLPRKNRHVALAALKEKPDIIEIAGNEILFILILAILCLIKGIRPEISGEEKFMNFAFLNALMRTETLPAPDPWMAGEFINYYYYGQFMYAFINKLNGIRTGVSYVLSMCTSITFLFTMSFSIIKLFCEGANKCGLSLSKKVFFPFSLIGALSVTFFGNSHSFFYNPESLGHRLMPFFERIGINAGQTESFFYPNSTRFIGHNPNSELWSDAGELIASGDFTIHEFPFYSFLIGDLHAHVAGTIVVMLIIPLLFQFVVHTASMGSVSSPDISNSTFGSSLELRLRYEMKRILNPYIIIVGCLLGVSIMSNYWDFLIYFILSAMALLVAHAYRTDKFISLPGFFAFIIQLCMILVVYSSYSHLPIVHIIMLFIALLISISFSVTMPCNLTQTGASMALLFFIANLCALPFQYHFIMISSALAGSVNQTHPFQFFILWITHIIFAIALLFVIIFKNRHFPADLNTTKDIKQAPLQKVTHFFRRRNPSDVFLCGTVVVSFMLLIAPEIFYVVDIYGGSYKRANTMFKFTFQAFILLSLIIAYTLFRLYVHKNAHNKHAQSKIIISTLMTLLLFIPAVYTLPAAKQWSRVNTPWFEIESTLGPLSALISISIVLLITILSVQLYTASKNNVMLNKLKLFSLIFLIVILLMPTLLQNVFQFPGVRLNFAFVDAYTGLDGTQAIKTRPSPHVGHSDSNALLPYALAIEYLNENVDGITNICESYGMSYTDFCIVSAYTGLPTIFGWQTHQWLWRFQGIYSAETGYIQDPDKPDLWDDIINPRKHAVDQIFTSDDPLLVEYYLQLYEVEYIIVGPLERQSYQRTMRANTDHSAINENIINIETNDLGEVFVTYDRINDELLRNIGEIIFEYDDLYVVHYSPSMIN